MRAAKQSELKEYSKKYNKNHINYLHHSMNDSRFVNNSRRKSKFQNRCIVKSMIAIQHIFVEVQLNKENFKSVF